MRAGWADGLLCFCLRPPRMNEAIPRCVGRKRSVVRKTVWILTVLVVGLAVGGYVFFSGERKVPIRPDGSSGYV